MASPHKYNCECGGWYALGKETLLRVYTKNPWFTHYITTCPKCGKQEVVWDISVKLAQYIGSNNTIKGDAVSVSVEEFAPEMVWRAYCRHHGKPFMLEPKFTSPRRARQIEIQARWAAYELEHGERIA
jgi:hypothetical protein